MRYTSSLKNGKFLVNPRPHTVPIVPEVLPKICRTPMLGTWLWVPKVIAGSSRIAGDSDTSMVTVKIGFGTFVACRNYLTIVMGMVYGIAGIFC